MNENDDDTTNAAPIATMSEFLATLAPGRSVRIIDALTKDGHLRAPPVSLHCSSASCGGLREFSGHATRGIHMSEGRTDIEILTYHCLSCGRSRKLMVIEIKTDTTGPICTKLEESPSYISPAPTLSDAPHRQALRFVGDLSTADSGLLERYARQSQLIVEFGVGGSTQIFAQAIPPEGTVISLDTNAHWIDVTRSRLKRLGVAERVQFIEYSRGLDWADRIADLVFVDGRDDLRLDFALRAWKLIKPHGAMLFHDTRRRWDFDNVLLFVQQAFLEVDEVHFNARHNGHASNISVVVKKIAEPYLDWNVAERRPDWRIGRGDVPDEFWGTQG